MERARSISKSMISYLKRAREYKEFLVKETKEFERGKRHLANMMGVEVDGMTQKDIDDAIKYLFPSGLFEPRARPIMRHPDILYQERKGAQFDIEGRPSHHLFYTIRPNYNEALTRIGALEKELNNFEDEQLALGVIDPPLGSQFDLSGREWIDYEAACIKYLEPITSENYDYLIRSLERLRSHPYSEKIKSFFESYTIEKEGQTMNLEFPTLCKDEKTGQVYAEVVHRHREHKYRVRTTFNGSGKVDIDGHDILRFKDPYLRRAILFPLAVSNMLDRVDIQASPHFLPKTVGEASIAGAIRYCVSMSIAAFVDEQTREKMRLSGLLTFDQRRKERKKFGQEGARRKYTWKKR